MGDAPPQEYWQALLRFATSIGAQDPVNRSDAAPLRQLSPEDRAFLEAALKSYAKETDPIEHLKRNLNHLISADFETASDEEMEKTLSTIDNIEDLCHQIDLANDFHKISGYRVLLPMLASSHSEFRSAAANLVGVLAQNNPYSQKELQKAGMMEVLLAMMDNDRSPEARTKAMFAVSCMVRDCEENEEAFASRQDGFSYLLRALQSDVPKLRLKAAFLLSSLFVDGRHKDDAKQIGLLDQMWHMWRSIDDDSAEIGRWLVRSLVNLVYDSPEMLEELCKLSSDIEQFLASRLSQLEQDSTRMEELTDAQTLLQLVTKDSVPAADR